MVHIPYDETYEIRYQLHHTLAGGPALAYPRGPLAEAISVLRRSNVHGVGGNIVRACYAADVGSVRAPDREGYTPLHIAASYFDAHAVKAILALESDQRDNTESSLAIYDDLFCRANVLHATPLELCEEQLVLARANLPIDNLRGERQGYYRVGTVLDGLKVAYALRCAMGEDVASAQDEAEYVQNMTAK